MAPTVDVVGVGSRTGYRVQPCLCHNPDIHRGIVGDVMRGTRERHEPRLPEIGAYRQKAGDAVVEDWSRDKCRSPGCIPTHRCCVTHHREVDESRSQEVNSLELQTSQKNVLDMSRSSPTRADFGNAPNYSYKKLHGKPRNFYLFEEQETQSVSPTPLSLTGASTTASFWSPPSSSTAEWPPRSPARRPEGESNEQPTVYDADQKPEPRPLSPKTRNPYLPEFCFSLKHGLLHEGLLYLFVLWGAPELLREGFHPSIKQVVERQSGFRD